MSDAKTIQSLAAELNRVLMNGARLPDPADSADPKRRIPVAKITGHELAAPAKLDQSANAELVGMVGGAEIVKVSRPAAQLTAAFNATRMANQALAQCLQPLATPVWTLEPAEITIADQGDLLWKWADGTSWPLHRFGPSLIAEIAKGAAQPGGASPTNGHPSSPALSVEV